MTEEQWLASADAPAMLAWLLSDETIQAGFKRPSDRKLRLFSCECLRPRCSYLSERTRSYVNWQQSHPDEAPADQPQIRDSGLAEHMRRGAAKAVVQVVAVTRESPSRLGGIPPARQAALLREVVGNPFRPVPVSPAWLTADVLRLAADAYQNNALEQLPILADALEEAGCDASELLAHLRGPGPHVRGCWALDLVLGRS
jgi:hypothetical protein